MSLPVALLVAAAAGFIALSYEIVWFRVYGFLTGGAASSFSVVLGVYLLGIAIGSLGVRRWCDDQGVRGDDRRLMVPALLVLAASLFGWALIPALAETVRRVNYVYTLPAVAGVAGLLGAVLPLVAHFGVPGDDRVGERVSWIYLANIAGSTVGTLLTGFVALDRWSLPTTAAVLALAGMALAAALAWWAGVRWRQLALLPVAGAMLWATPAAFDQVYEKLMYKRKWQPDLRFVHVLENRSGVVSTDAQGRVFGSGIYDGVFNTDLHDDINMVMRAYAVAALRPRYDNVLVVGFASGSWTQILANMPGVGHVTAIDINPAYFDLVRQVPKVASVLTNPKVTFVLDDARRWLRAHPEARFDLIVQNTTWHWRGHATGLLSADYHALTKAHLAPGGIDLFNTTSNDTVLRTGCQAFAHGFRIHNVLYGSEQPFEFDVARLSAALDKWYIDGKLPLDRSTDVGRGKWDTITATLRAAQTSDNLALGENCAEIRQRLGPTPLLTDDNMLTEWYRPWYAQPVGGE
ncbi:MAG: methyltransferase domain-containing protein [Deltaproteobacteria bacterium]|nr:methyltransferase domain-containing protein [Deltaproteobacteria bacterium]